MAKLPEGEFIDKAAQHRRDPRLKFKTGDTFGRLTVVDPDRCHKSALCRCQCGAEKLIRRSDLSTGRTKSCGCLRSEATSKRLTRHGKTKTRVHQIWKRILQRCNNPNSTDYKFYGGRGVVVCDRWDPAKGGSFENFLSDMGEPPSDKHWIDKDKHGNGLIYSPETCAWLTPTEQNRNRRDNRLIEHDGRIQCISAWAEEIGINESVIRGRLKRGWDHSRAVTQPARKMNWVKQ